MSELKLVVCDQHDAWSGTMHGSEVERVIAALSADPETIDELSEAFVRFMRPSLSDSEAANCSRKNGASDSSNSAEHDPRKSKLRNQLRYGLDDEPYDAGLVVIDLAAKLIVVESNYSSYGHRGCVYEYSLDGEATRFLNYHLDRSWKFLNDANGWQYHAQQRRKERTRDGLDTRKFLYGEPLLEFLVRSCLDHWHRREQIVAETRIGLKERLQQDADDTYQEQISERSTQELNEELFREIHRTWLMSPLVELDGKAPRDVLVERQEHISFDLDDRYYQWSAQGRCPPPLSPQAYAYRFAGFGTAENVLYYHLIRDLLAQCWENLESEMARNGEVLDRENYICSEIAQLALVRDVWMDQPENGYFGKSPNWFCQRERQRLPLVVTGPDMMPDCDCPLCQMMVDTSDPMLIGLDGSSLDDEFVFDFTCRTQEDWDQKKAEWRAKSERIEAGIAVRQELGLPVFPPLGPVVCSDDEEEWDGGADEDSEPPEYAHSSPISFGLWLFEVGSELADVIVGLRGIRNEFREQRLPDIELLNQHFATLRAACGQAQESISSSLIEPVIDRFRDDLYRIADLYPDVRDPCHMALVKLDEFPEFNDLD